MAALLLAATTDYTEAQETRDAPAKVVPIQVTGDPAKRFSLVVLSDGYTQAELPKFRQHLDKHLNVLWSLEPFRSYRNYINVYAVEIESPESGITCDPATRTPRNTPLKLYFQGGCENPNARGVLVDQESARRYARLATPDYDQILTIANTDTYGGIGGPTATTSGGNALGPYITPHEIGHSLGRLTDEYTYSERGKAGPAYAGPEPNSLHHTLLTEEQMRTEKKKWWRWLGEPSESGGLIGRYEGGMQRSSGVWRPSKHSMMISLGYYFDQVSRERMTQRISEQVELIPAATPSDAPVAKSGVIWIETAHPNSHELNITWELDGKPVTSARKSVNLELSKLALGTGEHKVAVRVVDPTDFVRDAEIRDTSFSATRSWTVTDAATVGAEEVRVAFTGSTPTIRPVGGTDVVYVETTHPRDRVLTVNWKLNGKVVANTRNSRSLPLTPLKLGPGTHSLSATIGDPGKPGAETLEWVIDNTGPTVTYALQQPSAQITAADGTQHYFMRDHFTMKLEPTDDHPGYVVAEFRVNGDGWHHYYGWPDAPPGTPFLFTARGTTIKELVYGSLSSEGLSPQPWEARVPGWGTHKVEYRGRDAAGNVGGSKQFRVTVLPDVACTSVISGQHDGALTVSTGTTCLSAATVTGEVTVSNGARWWRTTRDQRWCDRNRREQHRAGERFGGRTSPHRGHDGLDHAFRREYVSGRVPQEQSGRRAHCREPHACSELHGQPQCTNQRWISEFRLERRRPMFALIRSRSASRSRSRGGPDGPGCGEVE
jgi:hypothetical protein